MSTNQLNLAQKQLGFNGISGFTLAEVLITLGIIGIVAAMTIPTLLGNTQDAQFKTAYKKAFADASNIWAQMSVNNEVTSCTGPYDDTCDDANYDVFKSYFNVSKSYDLEGDYPLCWGPGEKFNNAVPTTGGGRTRGFTDSSGRTWVMVNGGYTGSVNGIIGDSTQILVDTNGLPGPNKFGKDRFVLEPADSNASGNWPRTANKIIPMLDRINFNAYDCPNSVTSACYGTSWLMNN